MCGRRGGLTLIELMVVMVIIALLAAIALPHFWGAKERSFRTAMQSDLRSFVTQQELYHDRLLTYAPTLETLEDFATSPGVVVTVTSASRSGWAATATHVSLVDAQCGVFFGSASAADAPPAVSPGVMACQ